MAEDAPVAIVTGGAQGLGAAISRALLGQGYKVCVADIQEAKGKEFVAEQQKAHGEDNVIFSCCDVTKEADYTRIFDLAISAFQKVDVLVNNAGIILEQDPKKVLDVNLVRENKALYFDPVTFEDHLGPIIGCQTALKYMGKSNGGKGGMVVNTASICGFIPHSSMPVYCASKHGVIGLTRSYGLPYHEEREGVIFAALCPFFTDTDLLKTSHETTLVPGLDFSKRPNLMSPDYVAQGVVKLLEDRINGSTLGVTHFFGYRYIGYQKEFEDLPLE